MMIFDNVGDIWEILFLILVIWKKVYAKYSILNTVFLAYNQFLLKFRK